MAADVPARNVNAHTTVNRTKAVANGTTLDTSGLCLLNNAFRIRIAAYTKNTARKRSWRRCRIIWPGKAAYKKSAKNTGFVIILALFLAAFLHLFITAKLFGGSLLKEEDKTGLIMELPPYHKPNYKDLFKFVWLRMGDVLKKALKIIVLVAVIFWALSYSSDNNINNSILYKIGTAIEPVTMWFGLRWQSFTAFLTSAVGKEAALGVFAAVFNTTGESVNIFNVTMGTAAVIRLPNVSPMEVIRLISRSLPVIRYGD